MTYIPPDETIKKIPFSMLGHMACEREHILTYYNEKLKICMELMTPKNRGEFVKPERAFYLNEEGSEEFKTIKELFKSNEALSRKAQMIYGTGKGQE